MEKIIEMKRKKDELLKQLRAMLAKADGEKRSLTDEEDTEYKRIEAEIDQLEADILDAEADLERRRKLAEREAQAKRTEPTGPKSPVIKVPQEGVEDVDPEKDFRNVGEFLFTIARSKRDGVHDPRLDVLREQREQTMGVGATGGYALPEQFDSTIRQVREQESIIRPRAAVIPAGSPPDAKLTFPALDQTSAQNIYGGVTVVHTGEGVTMTETTAKLREVSLEPKEISAYIVITDKLLNNWGAAGPFVTRQLSAAVNGQEDYDFMRGDGINKALGFINCAAAVDYARAGANAIEFADCYGMLARMLMRSGGGSYVWLASQTTIPQLAAMVDAGSHAIWLGGAGPAKNAGAGPIPSTLLGIPLVFCDRLPAIGTAGDLSLVNLAYYLIKDGSGPYAASSEHVYFTSNKTVFKIVWNVDAHPWLTEPIPLEGSTSNTVSPFVVLH
jgi:HK97 family phage major capsid protein